MVEKIIVILSVLSVSGCVRTAETDLPQQAIVIFEECPVHTSTKRSIGKSMVFPETVVDHIDGLCIMRSYIPPQTGSDVVFIYLAVNDTREKWLQALEEHRMNESGGQNYMVLNANDCKFLKEIDNRHIPQMLLSDRNDNPVDTDALRPRDRQTLRRTIDALI